MYLKALSAVNVTLLLAKDTTYRQTSSSRLSKLSLNVAKCITENMRLSGHMFRPKGWYHDDVIQWKHFLRYWPFVRGIHRSPVDSPHKDQWRGALMFPLICTWTNAWKSYWDVGDLRRHRTHYDVTVVIIFPVVLATVSFSCIWAQPWCHHVRCCITNGMAGSFCGP